MLLSRRGALLAGLHVGRSRFVQQAGHLRLQGLQRGVVGLGLGGAALQGGVLGLESLNLLLLLLDGFDEHGRELGVVHGFVAIGAGAQGQGAGVAERAHHEHGAVVGGGTGLVGRPLL